MAHTNNLVLCACTLLLIVGCSERKPETFPTPTKVEASGAPASQQLSDEQYEDRLLGMLIGSAIGDAMGAPTEMWGRKAIAIEKGYLSKPDRVTREHSPEGPWGTNLFPGATTDDTRWKFLAGQYLLTQKNNLSSKEWAKFIIGQHESELAAMPKTENNYDAIQQRFTSITWLNEWANVARPYVDNDVDGYANALSKFYGGEMSCAGMLYSPMIGAYFPGDPEKAYIEAFHLALFDLGYARDITALTAAYTSQAMKPGLPVDSITSVIVDVDPEGYFDSRLIGRVAYQIHQDAKSIAYEAWSMKTVPKDLILSKGFPYDSLYGTRITKAYELLDQKLKDIPFHAAEIHLINLTAIEFCNGEFRKSIEFVVNYGRDNDTVAAITGAILGAYWGVSKLPNDLVEPVKRVNKDALGLDLEQLAKDLALHR